MIHNTLSIREIIWSTRIQGVNKMKATSLHRRDSVPTSDKNKGVTQPGQIGLWKEFMVLKSNR